MLPNRGNPVKIIWTGIPHIVRLFIYVGAAALIAGLSYLSSAARQGQENRGVPDNQQPHPRYYRPVPTDSPTIEGLVQPRRTALEDAVWDRFSAEQVEALESTETLHEPHSGSSPVDLPSDVQLESAPSSGVVLAV